MQDKRRHKRFRLDLMEISGKMILANRVDIIDISLGGVALKTDRRLNIGKEYLIKLGDKGKSIDVKGIIADFLDSIGHDKKEAMPVTADRRLTVRFYITTPWEKTLCFPAQFKVKEISLSGMLIQTDQALGIESMIPMGLSLQADNPVNFVGRVASCRMTEATGQAHYEIGVEFKDLTDMDRTSLKTFIDYLAVTEV